MTARGVRGVCGEQLLVLEREVQTREHGVERVAELFGLIVRPGEREPFIEVFASDAPRCLGDCAQRSQHAPRHQPGHTDGDDHEPGQDGSILGKQHRKSRVDCSVLIGLPIAEAQFHASSSPDLVYVRANPSQVVETQGLLARAAYPQNPEQVNVSVPSNALTAQVYAQNAFTSLFLGLGAVALLVAGVGIANVMVISVLERRSEIGLRRALGATRPLVAVQFLAESYAYPMRDRGHAEQ